MAKSIHYYLVKLNRFLAWLLLPVVLIFLTTGFSMSGRLGVNRLVPRERAQALHQNMIWPLVTLFTLHAGLSVYYSFRRWGWIGRKRNP
jgi:hypothetical protein